MLSDNDNKIIEDIKSSLKSIEANLDNLGFVYKTASNLFRISGNLEDKNLKSSLKLELAKIIQTQYKEEIQQAVKSVFSFISDAEKFQPQTKRYFEGATPIKTEEYNRDCEKYSSYTKNIIEVEKKILDSPYYQKKLHEEIEEHKIWKGYRHARLTGNLRIIYTWKKEEKSIIFYAIITKNEFDKNY